MQAVRHNVFKAMTCILLCCIVITAYPEAHAAESLVSAPLIVRKESNNGMVRVYLSSLGNPGTLNITVSGSYTVNGNSSEQLASGSSIILNFSSSTGNLSLTANGKTKSMGSAFKLRRHSLSGTNGLKITQARVSGNLYPGDLSFVSVSSGSSYKLYTIAYVFVEDYLYGVLPYEMGSSSPSEALRAQAVTARTYTLKAMSNAGGRLYDVVDTTGDQVYSGTPSGSSACKAAVDATKGIVSMIGGSFTATYYTASNGGQIESVKNIWGSSAYGYIRVKDDPYDLGNPDSRVRSYAVSGGAVQSGTLAQLLKAKAATVFGTSDVTDITVSNIVPHTPKYPEPSRLYTKIDFYVNAMVVGKSRTGVLTFDIFSELETPLGMSINTTANELWTVTRTDTGFTLKARRYGHGTGLSQRGAMYMAKLGYSYAQILAFYFEGCSRVQYSLTSSILSPIVDGDDSTEISATQVPADLTDVEPCTAIVSLSSASARTALRSTPETGGAILTMLKQGAGVTVLALSDDWYLVKYGALCGYLQKTVLTVSGTPTGNTANVTQLSGHGVVTGTDSLNLRKNASLSADILAQIPRGTILPLLSLSSGWAYTQYDRLAGYVYVELLTQYSRYPVAINDLPPGASVNSTTGAVPLRITPGSTAYVIAQLPNGTLVSVQYDDGSWCRVLYDGITGYILSSQLTYTDQPVDESEDMIGSGEFAATANPDSGSLNLRVSASLSSEIIAEIPKGTSLIVAQKGTTWCAVRYRGVPGFVMTQHILFTPSTETPVANARVNTVSGSLNLRAAAKATAAVLITIPKDTVIPVYEKGSQWCRVGYAGKTGYVMSGYLIFTANPTATPVISPTPMPTPAESAAPTASPVVSVAPTSSPALVTLNARVTTASGSLNLRETTSANARILTRIPRNQVIPVYEKGSQWCRVGYAGKTGYVMIGFLTFISSPTATPVASPTPATTPAESALPTTSPAAVVSTATVTTASGSLNLRETASANARILTRIPRNQLIPVYEKGNQWCRVGYAGKTGYVMSQFLRFEEVTTATPAASPLPTPTPTGSAVPTSTPVESPAPASSPDPAVLTAKVTTVSGSLNLRENAIAHARVLTRIPRNTVIDVLSKGSVWSKVKYQGYNGYVMSSFLSFPSSGSTAAGPEAAQEQIPEWLQDKGLAKVSTVSGSLNLRESPRKGTRVIITIPQNAIVHVNTAGTSWCNVTYGEYTGHVMTFYLGAADISAGIEHDTPPENSQPSPSQAAGI